MAIPFNLACTFTPVSMLVVNKETDRLLEFLTDAMAMLPGDSEILLMEVKVVPSHVTSSRLFAWDAIVLVAKTEIFNIP